jgi:hypothetical protein
VKVRMERNMILTEAQRSHLACVIMRIWSLKCFTVGNICSLEVVWFGEVPHAALNMQSVSRMQDSMVSIIGNWFMWIYAYRRKIICSSS